MKIRDRKNIYAKNVEELKTLLGEAKDSLLSLRLEKAQNKLKNTRSIFWKRKEIARISTFIKEKELKASS